MTRGSDYCYRFLDLHLRDSQFDKAYEMLADSIKAPETEEGARGARLAKEEEKEKEANREIWRQVFGIDDLASPRPEEGTAALRSFRHTAAGGRYPNAGSWRIRPQRTRNVSDDAEHLAGRERQNGPQCHAGSGRYGRIPNATSDDPGATPDPKATVDPNATIDPNTVDESNIPADQRDTDLNARAGQLRQRRMLA